jgi:hypothetical protein
MIEYGGGGAPTTIISGWFRFGATSVKPLTRLLPPLITYKGRSSAEPGATYNPEYACFRNGGFGAGVGTGR